MVDESWSWDKKRVKKLSLDPEGEIMLTINKAMLSPEHHYSKRCNIEAPPEIIEKVYKEKIKEVSHQ